MGEGDGIEAVENLDVEDEAADGESEEDERGQVHIWTSNAPALLSL